MKAFVIFRDRVTYGRKCLAAMQAAGLETVIVDHGSTWPEAVEWLIGLRKSGDVQVRDCGGGNPRDLWNRAWFRAEVGPSERYVVTDPDVVPSEDCPDGWLQHLGAVLDRHPFYHKAGLGLRLDRIPEHYDLRDKVLGWEGQFWKNSLEDGVYDANIDTTLALHVPLRDQGCHSFLAARTGHPYVADHLAWYEDRQNLTDELRWYHEHAEPGISCWTIPGRSAVGWD